LNPDFQGLGAFGSLKGIVGYAGGPRLEEIKVVKDHKYGEDDVGHHSQKDDVIKDRPSPLFPRFRFHLYSPSEEIPANGFSVLCRLPSGRECNGSPLKGQA
jgi:hypothetical protein